MKKIIAIFTVMFVFISTAVAQSDASLTWSVQGVQAVKEVSIDADFTSRYIAANGIVTSTDGVSIPVTGTCFGATNGGAYCSFFIGAGGTMILDLQPSLNGTLRTLDNNLVEQDSGNVTLTNLI